MATPVRHGKCVSLTIDYDALEHLRRLAPSGKSHGRFVSELVRAEVSRREERVRIARLILSTQDDIEPEPLLQSKRA